MTAADATGGRAAETLGSGDVLLVTGGAGFIGANFVHLALARTPARIVVLDKLTYAGHRASLRAAEGDSRFSFVEGSIADRRLLDDLMDRLRPRWILNFAAESHVDRSIDDPRAFLDTNAVGTFELLEATRRYLERRAAEARERFRLLHVSTDEVYGSLGPRGAFSETSPYAPSSPYAASKAAADHLVQAYVRTYGLPALLTNCSNNYGPYQFPEKLIPLMLRNALEGRDLPIYGDGRNVRDWLFVEDHCEGLLRVLAAAPPGERYNLGGRCERTNLELVDTLCALLEERVPARSNAALRRRGLRSYAELKTFVPDRPGHDRRYAIDPSKIERELGWRARHSFEAGLARTVDWYLANRAWCEAVEAGRGARLRRGLAQPERAP